MSLDSRPHVHQIGTSCDLAMKCVPTSFRNLEASKSSQQPKKSIRQMLLIWRVAKTTQINICFINLLLQYRQYQKALSSNIFTRLFNYIPTSVFPNFLMSAEYDNYILQATKKLTWSFHGNNSCYGVAIVPTLKIRWKNHLLVSWYNFFNIM